LAEHEAHHPVLVSTTSVTGRDAAQSRLQVPATLLPADFPWVIHGAVRRIRPAVLIVIETELWPNLFRAAGMLGVPLLLVSARLSPRAAAGYAWVRPILRAAFRHVHVIAAQTAEDASRFIALGASPDRVRVVGNLKFARQPPKGAEDGPPVDLGDRVVVIAASTQPGEEEVILDAARRTWAEHPSMLLVLAPRRPERFDGVARLVVSRGLSLVRRSQQDSRVDEAAQVFLLDTVGELSRFFPLAKAAFVGGTLVPLGGHNVLEPAVYGIPVSFGPHVENVREAAATLLEVGGGVMVQDATELAALWTRVLSLPAEGVAMGDRARAEMTRRAAIAPEILSLVQKCLRNKS